MDINRIVKDSVRSVKNTYDKTQLNPFKVPAEITITHKFDLVGTYGQVWKWYKSLTPAQVEEISKVIKDQVKMIQAIVEKDK